MFVVGGTPDPIAFAPFDYQYDWINDCSEIDPAQYGNDPNAPNATNLPGGTYGINVTDANGCLATTCFDMIPPDSLQSPAIIQNISCTNDEGCITPNLQGGSSVYVAYEWTGNIGANAPDAATLCGLPAGPYSLTVTDSNGCSEDFDYEITDVSTPEASVDDVTDASCYNVCDGTATVSVTGGEGPFMVMIDGVASDAVVPGTIATDAWQERVDRNPQIFDKLKPWYPLGRVGTPADVTEAVLFILSDKAQWISGSEFVVDGGLLAGLAPMYKMVEGSD